MISDTLQTITVGAFTLTRTLSRSKGLLDACDAEGIDIKGCAVFLSDVQRFALVVDSNEQATLFDDAERSVHFFHTVPDAERWLLAEVNN